MVLEGKGVLKRAGSCLHMQYCKPFCRVFLRIPQELEKCGSGERISDFLAVRMMLGDATALLSFSPDPGGFCQPHTSSQMAHTGEGAAEMASKGENHGLIEL